MARIDMAELRAALSSYDYRDLAQAIADVDRRDLLDAMYPVDGPHDHDRTFDAAAGISTLVRYLNYATMAADGTPHPGTLDRIVAHIEAAAGGLEQTTWQVAQRLDEFAAMPLLASDGMAYKDLTPEQIADRAAVVLRQTCGLLGQLHTVLSEAHDHVARLYIHPEKES